MDIKEDIKAKKIFFALLTMGLIIFIVAIHSGENSQKTYVWAVEETDGISSTQAKDLPPLTSRSVFSILKTVEDPELAISIVDMGLVYEVQVDGDTVFLIMTLTTPKCPLASRLLADIRNSLFSHPNIRKVNLSLTFDPPWTVERMSTEARNKLMGIPTVSTRDHEKEPS
jgi:metal-sulfur cluster biosynthetic enzyme